MDLQTDDQLRQAAANAIEQHRRHHHLDEWLARLKEWLTRVAAIDRATFCSPAFQRELWDSETISATGQGRVDVSRVIAEPGIAERLWTLREATRGAPGDWASRTEFLAEAWAEIASAIEPFVDRRPRLKMYRVFASLWPESFTTVADYGTLLQVGRAMRVSRKLRNPVELHQRVRARIDAALGPAPDATSIEALERMTLPWVLFRHHVQARGEEATEVAGDAPGEAILNPLPAERRRRGMLAIGGLIPSVRAMLQAAKDGCTRADFLENIRSINPRLAPSSLATNLNALISEWGALRAEGDELHLTPRGEALLESGDAEEVSDWLLTRILGFDNLLHMLHARPMAQKEVIAALQGVNPNWTSDFAPTVLINWIKGMGLAEVDAGRVLRLTARGHDWATRIHWPPESLAPLETAPADAVDTERLQVADIGGLRSRLPGVDAILAAFPPDAAFDRSLVQHLHAGLWSHTRRHFAVLTGLSGAGKTLLASSYARALGGERGSDAFHISTVQPGWHDPTSLLGYVNPIDGDVYVRTGFLDFLLRAAADPDRPYVALLDEMNLSHPEQYLAPLLSAMETGGDIELHAQGEQLGGIPSVVRYPSNLVLIGTVNMDETTHGLSDKVLDRAWVIEFWDIDVNDYPGWSRTTLPAADAALVRELLDGLGRALRPMRLHFGWRTIADVIGYVEMLAASGVAVSEALDRAVHSKVLPKLRGEDSKGLRTSIDALKALLKKAGLTRSAAKVNELDVDLQEFGSVRFWR